VTKPGDGRWTRTFLLGGALSVLTLAGHTAADGAVDAVGVAVTTAVSLGLARALATRTRSVPALVGILLAGQALLHVVLTVATGHASHGGAGGAMPASVMIVAHAAAAVVAAVLIGHADSVAAAWRRFTRTLLGGPLPSSPSGPAFPGGLPSDAAPISSSVRLRHHVIRRGPPVSVALA
jgi:hypothetical protein